MPKFYTKTMPCGCKINAVSVMTPAGIQLGGHSRLEICPLCTLLSPPDALDECLENIFKTNKVIDETWILNHVSSEREP